MIKLNLGSGETEIQGFIRVDRSLGMEAYPLDLYSDDSVDEIRASHILEHFPQEEVAVVLTNWVDKLVDGGTIKIAVPDLRKISKNYLDNDTQDTAHLIMGGQVDENDYHKAVFDIEALTTYMQSAGLTDIKVWKDDVFDTATLPISLNLMGTKSSNTMVKIDCKKIFACMSMPRLAFTENMYSAMRAFGNHGVKLFKATGVFWGQCLTRTIQTALDEGAEYIITLDYDTWFTRDHWLAMIKLLHEYPEADAIIPVQIMRERETPLVGVRTESGAIVKEISSDQMEQDLTRIVSGHFGLSVFRASVFEKLKKPWFHAVPDSNGEWSDGRQDEDIAFWNNFNECGLQAYMANKVTIGHMQMMCTFPGNKENGWQPIHSYMGKVEAGEVPAHCIPEALV